MVEQIARSILDRYWDGKLPVDPVAIAHAAGVRVVTDTGNLKVSGKFDVIGGNPVISCNKDESYLRQRFTLAHELGHYFLQHGPRFRDSAENFSTLAYDPIETAANRFAAELLIPSSAVNMLIKKHKLTDFAQLADRFKVSQVAMKIRLTNLGWL